MGDTEGGRLFEDGAGDRAGVTESGQSEPKLEQLEAIADANHGQEGEDAARFSTAQLRAKVAQARYEAKAAVDAELLAAKKELVKRRYEMAECERQKEKAVATRESLQARLDAVLKEHKQTLAGMRENTQVEKLVATLDVEKATREKLRQAFEKQQQDLSRAQERVEALDAQVANYQKTETVLAQSVAHLQHRFASKDQQRAVTVEQAQKNLVDQHEQEMSLVREELAVARRTEQVAQEQLQALQKEHKALLESTQQTQQSQESVAIREQELLAKVTKLETEKAVLYSKAEQIQKADAQLRSQLHAQSEEIAALRQEKEALQRDNKELGEIASDLMQMAERQHADNVKRGISPARPTSDTTGTPSSTHDEDEVFLQKRKKRLRLSLG